VLQEREVLAVGSTRPVPVDLRVVAATHRPLRSEAAAGRFREDLLARIAAFEFHVPPLRDRRADLGLLVNAILAQHRVDPAQVRLGQDAARALLAHDWPHNIRELEHALTTALALAGDGPVRLEHLPAPLRSAAQEGSGKITGPDPVTPPSSKAEPVVLDEDELRGRLVALLSQHGGNISAVGRDLGKARVQVHRWLRRFGLRVEDYRAR
jgi:transcriptional regulator of acetoin/glycerol metabolism